MEAKTFLEAYAINTLYDRGVSIDKAIDLIDKRFLKLSYSTGAMEVSQIVMLDEDDNFYGVDIIGRLVAGKFIDDRYIAFYIINEDKSVTRFIGYNSVSLITLQFVDTKVSTGMHIEEVPAIDDSMSIEPTYNKIIEAINAKDPNELLKFKDEIRQYQEYVEGIRTIRIKLGLDREAPVIKELKQ